MTGTKFYVEIGLLDQNDGSIVLAMLDRMMDRHK